MECSALANGGKYLPRTGQWGKRSALANGVFRTGQWSFVNNGNKQLLVWHWSLDDERRLCVMNFNAEPEADQIKLPDAKAAPDGNDTIPVVDLLSNTRHLDCKIVELEVFDMRRSPISLCI